MVYPILPEIEALGNLDKAIKMLGEVPGLLNTAERTIYQTRDVIAAQWQGVAGPAAVRTVDRYCDVIDVFYNVVTSVSFQLTGYRPLLNQAKLDLESLNRRRKELDERRGTIGDELWLQPGDQVKANAGLTAAAGRMDDEYDDLKKKVKESARTTNKELERIAGRLTRHFERSGKVGEAIDRLLRIDRIDGGDNGVSDRDNPPPKYIGNMKEGDVGTNVQAVQALLAARGWNVTTDGHFGPQTKSQLLAFQREKGIEPATGKLDTKTWEALWEKKITR